MAAYRDMDHLQYIRAAELGFSEGYYRWRIGRTGPVLGMDGKPRRIPPPHDPPPAPLPPYAAYVRGSNLMHAKRIKGEI